MGHRQVRVLPGVSPPYITTVLAPAPGTVTSTTWGWVWRVPCGRGTTARAIGAHCTANSPHFRTIIRVLLLLCTDAIR